MIRRKFATFVLMAAALMLSALNTAHAASAEEINTDARAALEQLYKTNPTALALSQKAKAVLVFPKIIKAGLVLGGSYGEGILYKDSQTAGYYNSVMGSVGLQIGAETYGYVLFLMNDNATEYLARSSGWEIGVGPTVVVVNEGAARNLSTTTLKDDVYAVIFNQQGLMASLSIEGSKISKIDR